MGQDPSRIDRWKEDFHGSFRGKIEGDDARRRAQRYVDWIDHGILRRLWSNFAEVAPGVYRANHPDHARLASYAKRYGIRTVLSLRSENDMPFNVLERESAEALGLNLVHVPMSARAAPAKAALLRLMDAFDKLERPMVMHCKSGADRSSLASAVYLLDQTGASVAEARRQFSIRFIHFRWTKTGVLDLLLDTYESRLTLGAIGFRDWVEAEYEAEALQEAFDRRGQAG